VNLFGHANPRINKAVKDQLDRLEHVMLAGFTHEPVVELSERLSKRTQGVLGHCFYASDGASAVEVALKMSFHYWQLVGQGGKQEFVCLSGGYHGETLGALHVTDVPLFRTAYGPLLHQAHVVPAPHTQHAVAEAQALVAAHEAAVQLEVLLQRRFQQISALILEPLVQCAAGMRMHHPVYLQRVRALCDHYQVHLIADEIAVGCGRTGSFFASEQAGIWPDFMCLSKGISGGYLPLSLVMTRDSIFQAFYSPQLHRGFLHSHSYTGNPLACRAALATLDIFEADGVLERNRLWAASFTRQLSQALSGWIDAGQISALRHCGMIWAFDVKTCTAPDFARRFFSQALSHGLLLRPIGSAVYLMPPYVLDPSETAFLVEQTALTLKASLA
jgi:adenosylmethionine-8-amino-7-oxononanoate aminotransferase